MITLERKRLMLTQELTEPQRLFIEQLYASDIAQLTRIQQCPHCRLDYSEWQSVGRWSCRTHPGDLVRLDPVHSAHMHWSCCKWPLQDNKIDGCRRADHLRENSNIHHPRSKFDQFIMPLPLYLMLPQREERWVLDLYDSQEIQPEAWDGEVIPDAYSPFYQQRQEPHSLIVNYGDDEDMDLTKYIVSLGQISPEFDSSLYV